MDVEQPVGYYYKDRFFSVKVRFLKEGKWHPAIAIGINDPLMHYNDHSNDAKSLTAFGNCCLCGRPAKREILLGQHYATSTIVIYWCPLKTD